MQLTYVSRALREARKYLIPVMAAAAVTAAVACGNGPRLYNLTEVSKSTEAEINQLIGLRTSLDLPTLQVECGKLWGLRRELNRFWSKNNSYVNLERKN